MPILPGIPHARAGQERNKLGFFVRHAVLTSGLAAIVPWIESRDAPCSNRRFQREIVGAVVCNLDMIWI